MKQLISFLDSIFAAGTHTQVVHWPNHSHWHADCSTTNEEAVRLQHRQLKVALTFLVREVTRAITIDPDDEHAAGARALWNYYTQRHK